MTVGIRSKLFLVSLGLIAVSMLGVYFYISHSMGKALTEQIRAELFTRLALMEMQAGKSGIGPLDTRSWSTFAAELGRQGAARVTVIDGAGRVIGDSDIKLEDLGTVENHAGRPEVAEALHGRPGSAMRWSETLQKSELYVAVPLRLPDGSKGAVRAATPLSEVDRTLSRFRSVVLAASALALAIAAAMSILAAHWMSRGVRQITDAARRMSAGDLTARCETRGNDELSELGRALNRLAASLSRTLDSLKGEKELLERVLSGMQEGVLLLDVDGRVAAFNASLREMLLLGPDIVGRSALEVVRNASLKDLLERSRQSGKTEWVEMELGDIKPRMLLVHAVPTAQGGILAVFVDVTELRKLETVRKDFVANVSHELRTPVASIRSAAETLRGAASADPAATEKFIDIIERNAARMASLIDDLLELSRIESRKYKLTIEVLDPMETAGRVIELAGQQAAAKRIKLALEPGSGGKMVNSDRRALEQVLSNLLDNAIKYSPEGSYVTVGASDSGGMVAVSVSDNGPGIEPQHMERLFERFYRVDKGRSKDLGGTGLGLSIVKNLVEAMGGTVEVQSTVGKGSVFRVSLPRGSTQA
jgi:two-component system phosphate regulon sensor histidine kinase PhoR